ncbi:MAG TPA: M48 family metallopeptidase [Candidatus Limnocylindria bacterium]|nr:M48 family metallopeptidase [Candidatus Limnocylindria bacterium]
MVTEARPAPPTTFYREIARNRRRSWLLIAAVIVVLGLLGGAIGYASGFGWGGVVMAVLVAGALSVGSFFAGDALVMATSGAREIDRAKPPDRYQQLVNVVEEMRLAGGLPPPRIWVIEDSAPNAFATGRDPRHASVAVTTGLLDKLDREQLQGVIGHEMSHVGNLDIRFTLLVGVLVGSIALLADWFLRFTFWGGGRRSGGDSDRGGGGAAALIFILALVLAVVAPLIGRLVQAAVSRSRESLADATAVDLTRNPIGLARALRTISDDREVLEVANRATQHLYIVNPIKSFEERAKSLWDTHPPIGERIRALEGIAGQMGVAERGSPMG